MSLRGLFLDGLLSSRARLRFTSRKTAFGSLRRWNRSNGSSGITIGNGTADRPESRTIMNKTIKIVKKKTEPTQPPFESEAQEAEWWAKHQSLIADRFDQASATGKLGRGTVARMARERALKAGPSPTITIRLPETDIARARTLAAGKGLWYQTYVKMLLHQALNAEEQTTLRR